VVSQENLKIIKSEGQSNAEGDDELGHYGKDKPSYQGASTAADVSKVRHDD